MEWLRIESKWHDMARRLQQGRPSPVGAAHDGLTRPERKLPQETDPQTNPRTADDAAPRPTA